MTVQVGDVFYASWGYDQTNIDFAKVVKVSPSGKTVICQMMSKTRVNEQNVAPDRMLGIQFRLHIRTTYRGEDSLKGHYPYVQESYPSCRRFNRVDTRPFPCVRNLDVSDYRYWLSDKKHAMRNGCAEMFEEPNIVYRDDGSFWRYSHPVYETPFGSGH